MGTRVAAQELLTLSGGDPRAARLRAMARISALAGYDMAIYYTVRGTRGCAVKTNHLVVGAEPEVADTMFSRLRAAPAVSFSLSDLTAPTRRERTSFVEDGLLWPGSVWRESTFVRTMLHSIGMEHQQRLLVYHGRRFVGWIGGLREPRARPFGARERTLLQPWVDAVSTALVAADRLEEASTPVEGADFVLLADGRVSHASASGQAWLQLDGFAESLRAAARALDAGRQESSVLLGRADARITRVVGDGECRYVAYVTRANAYRLDLLASLTPNACSARRFAPRTPSARGRSAAGSSPRARSTWQASWKRLLPPAACPIGWTRSVSRRHSSSASTTWRHHPRAHRRSQNACQALAWRSCQAAATPASSSRSRP